MTPLRSQRTSPGVLACGRDCYMCGGSKQAPSGGPCPICSGSGHCPCRTGGAS